MTILQTIILSVVEGITEFLPISSTGHLILTTNLLGIHQTEFVKSFEIIIQLGAILSVVVIYFKKLISNLNIWKNILTAFVPTAIVGFMVYEYVKWNLIGNSLIVVISLFLGGISMLLVERYSKRIINDNLTTRHYLLIGLMQSISVIPGVSRAFATIFGGMLVGMNRKKATEFSFLLAIPTMFGATVLDIVKTDISKWSDGQLTILTTGFITSFIVAYFVVKWLIKYVQNHDFRIFGWYRIILAILFFLVFL